MRILLLDLETSPNQAWVWGLYDQNISIDQIVESGRTLCWAAKWLGEPEILFDSEYQSTPTDMIKRIHTLVDEADAIVTWNGLKFDLPTLNKEFLLLGLMPPSPYKQIDLLKTSRKQFKFPSHKLDYVARTLGCGSKHPHKGFELWIGCMNRDPESWATMEAYNKQDVILLEQVYYKLLPWIHNHPNVTVYTEPHPADDPVMARCASCGSAHVQKRGYAYTKVAKYQQYHCMECGSWSRERLQHEKPHPDMLVNL